MEKYRVQSQMRKMGDYYNSHITLANSGAHSFGNGAYILDTNLPAFLVLKALAFNEMPRELGILEQRAGRDGHMDPPPQSPNNIFFLRTKSKE